MRGRSSRRVGTTTAPLGRRPPAARSTELMEPTAQGWWPPRRSVAPGSSCRCGCRRGCKGGCKGGCGGSIGSAALACTTGAATSSASSSSMAAASAAASALAASSAPSFASASARWRLSFLRRQLLNLGRLLLRAPVAVHAIGGVASGFTGGGGANGC